MTQTAAAGPRYYVTRTNGTIQRLASLAAAKRHADALYSHGIVAPLVIVATSREEALAKAQRCYRGEISTREARRA